MNKFNAQDKKIVMEAGDAIMKNCIEKLDLKRCTDIASFMMKDDVTEYLTILSSLVLNEIDNKADLDKMLQVYRVMFNVCFEKKDIRKTLFFYAVKTAMADDQKLMKKLGKEAEKASQIVKKYEDEVCDIYGGREYMSGRIDHYAKLAEEINA